MMGRIIVDSQQGVNFFSMVHRGIYEPICMLFFGRKTEIGRKSDADDDVGMCNSHLFFICWQITKIQPQLLEENEG